MTNFKYTLGAGPAFGAHIAIAQGLVGQASTSISSVSVTPPAADGASQAAQVAFQAAAELYGSNILDSLSTTFDPLSNSYSAVENAAESQDQQAASSTSSVA